MTKPFLFAIVCTLLQGCAHVPALSSAPCPPLTGAHVGIAWINATGDVATIAGSYEHVMFSRQPADSTRTPTLRSNVHVEEDYCPID